MWLASEFDEIHARFSPDGAWVAYSSKNVPDRPEPLLFVQGLEAMLKK